MPRANTSSAGVTMEETLLNEAATALRQEAIRYGKSSLMRTRVDPTWWEQKYFDIFMGCLASPAVYKSQHPEVFNNYGPTIMRGVQDIRKLYPSARYPPGYLLPIHHFCTYNVGKQQNDAETRAWTKEVNAWYEEQDIESEKQEKGFKK